MTAPAPAEPQGETPPARLPAAGIARWTVRLRVFAWLGIVASVALLASRYAIVRAPRDAGERGPLEPGSFNLAIDLRPDTAIGPGSIVEYRNDHSQGGTSYARILDGPVSDGTWLLATTDRNGAPDGVARVARSAIIRKIIPITSGDPE